MVVTLPQIQITSEDWQLVRININKISKIQNSSNIILMWSYSPDETFSTLWLPYTFIENITQDIYVKRNISTDLIPNITIVEEPFAIAQNGGVPNDVDRQLGIEGYRSSITGGNVWNDIWEGSALDIPAPDPAGVQLSFKCNNANDTAGGSGARLLKVDYLRVGQEGLFSETVPTNGGTGDFVATDVEHIIDFKNIESGSNGIPEGTIELHEKGVEANQYSILAEGNKSRSTLRHLLPSSTFYITDVILSGDTKGVDVVLRTTSDDDGNVYPNTYQFGLQVTLVEGGLPIPLNSPIVIPGGADMKVSAKASVGGGNITAYIRGYVKI